MGTRRATANGQVAIAAALAVVAVAIIGCSQPSGGPTDAAGPSSGVEQGGLSDSPSASPSPSQKSPPNPSPAAVEFPPRGRLR